MPFRAIFERAAVGMAQVSLEGRFLLVNQGLCDFCGLSREELLERTFQQITHPDDLDLSVAVCKRLITGEIQTHTSFEKRYVHKDGHVVWGKITIALVRDTVSNEPRYFVSVIEDITQRKQAEQAWHESEKRFRFLVDNAPVLMWIAGPDKLCTYFNKPWLEFTGRSLESELGNGWAEGVHPDDLQRCVGTYTRAFDRREEFRMEYRLRRHDGEYRWIFDIGAPLFNEDRSFSGYIGSCVDITDRKEAEAELEKHRQHLKELVRERTGQLEAANVQLQIDIAERKRVEEALRESETQFRTFFDTVAVGTAELDASGHFLQVNRRLCQITGYSREELLGMTVADLMHPEDRDRDKERLDLHLQGEFPAYELERRCIRKDRSVIWVQLTAAMIRNSDGKLLRSARIIQDISERKRAQEALRLSEERLRILGDNLPNSAVFQYTLEPHGTPRFLYISAGVERLNGVKVEDVLKDASVLFRQIVSPQWPEVLETEKISARDLSMFEREVQMRLPDGQLRWMHVLARPRRMPDGQVIWDGVQSDITERKQAEQALLRSEKLAMLGRMAATIAHEINNPLDAVMNLQFLAKSIEGLPESARGLLEMADAELKRVAHITRQSLGFYRESNAPTLTSIGAVLDSAIDLQKSKINAKHAIVDKQWDGDVQISAVAGELRQVFSNLLSNSLDAIEERGTVKLRVSAHNRHVRITVADNGKGIAPSTRQRIFEPFFTTKDTYGTGLGLWVSQQIIEKHGGSILVRSNTDGVRRGTTFSVVLPVGPTPMTQSQLVGV